MITSEAQLPMAFKPLFHPARYKAYHGGRGGAKSRSFATALIIKSTQEKLLILCCREFQNSIKDSVKRILEDSIVRLGLEESFESTQTTIINTETGSEFIFFGLFNNADNIKSTEGVNICWVEEAHTISQTSIDLLFPTIREEDSEIWLSWNPRFETDPIHKIFVVDETPPSSLVCEVNYEDNPWFPQVLRDQMEFDRQTDQDKYRHIWLGECVVHSEAQIFSGCWVEVDTTPEPPEDVVQRWGLDFGFSTDPSACIRSWISGRTLYIDREAYGRRVEIDDLPEFMEQADEDIAAWPIRADSARPDTISYLNNQGFNVVGSKKGKGSINDGIQRIRSYNVVINGKRCPKTVEEFTRYSYKVDKNTGSILPLVEDKWNHCCDSIRYSLEGTENILVFDGIRERSIKADHKNPDEIPVWWNVMGAIRYATDGESVIAILIAVNPDTDECYMVNSFKSGALSSPTALRMSLKDWGRDIMWVTTGIGLSDRTSKDDLDKQMKTAGFNLYCDQIKDKIEAGTSETTERLLLGKLKIDENLTDFWKAFRVYSRDDGIIKTSTQFGIMDALRVAVSNARYAAPTVSNRGQAFTADYQSIPSY